MTSPILYRGMDRHFSILDELARPNGARVDHLKELIAQGHLKELIAQV